MRSILLFSSSVQFSFFLHFIPLLYVYLACLFYLLFPSFCSILVLPSFHSSTLCVSCLFILPSVSFILFNSRSSFISFFYFMCILLVYFTFCFLHSVQFLSFLHFIPLLYVYLSYLLYFLFPSFSSILLFL